MKPCEQFRFDLWEGSDPNFENLTIDDVDLEDYNFRFAGSEFAQIRYFHERGCMPKSREELEANDW